PPPTLHSFPTRRSSDLEPGQVQTVRVAMRLIPGARPPSITAELKLTVEPGRAAVFVDDNYAGHASEFGGALHSLLISPGKHRIKDRKSTRLNSSHLVIS